MIGVNDRDSIRSFRRRIDSSISRVVLWCINSRFRFSSPFLAPFSSRRMSSVKDHRSPSPPPANKRARPPGVRRGVIDPKAREREAKRLRERSERLYDLSIERQSTTFWWISWRVDEHGDPMPSRREIHGDEGSGAGFLSSDPFYPSRRRNPPAPSSRTSASDDDGGGGFGARLVRCVVRRTRRAQTIHVHLFDETKNRWTADKVEWKAIAESSCGDLPTMPSFPRLAEGHETYRAASDYLFGEETSGQDLYEIVNRGTPTIQQVMLCLMCGFRCYEYLHHVVWGHPSTTPSATTTTTAAALYMSLPRYNPSTVKTRLSIGTRDALFMTSMMLRRLTDEELLETIRFRGLMARYVPPPKHLERTVQKRLARARIAKHVHIFVNDPQYAWCRRRLRRLFELEP